MDGKKAVRGVLLVLIFGMVLLMCADKDGASDDAREDATAVPVGEPTADCAASFQTYADKLSRNPSVDESPLMRATLDGCSNRDDWIKGAAVWRYSGSVLFSPMADLGDVNDAFCSGNEDARACG